MHSFVRLTSVDLGFDPRQTVSFDLVLPGHYLAERKLDIANAVAERLSGLRGVIAAGFTDGPPLSNRTTRPYGAFAPPRKPGDEREEDDLIDQRLVSPGYLRALGVRLAAGRWLEARDGQSRPPGIMVTRAYASYYFGVGATPVGALLPTTAGPATIVGVIDDVRFDGVGSEPRFTGFVDPRPPLELNDAMLKAKGRTRSEAGNRLFLSGFNGTIAYAFRTTGDPRAYARDIRAIVQEIDPAAAIDSLMTMDAVVGGTVAQPRFYAVLIGVFAALAASIAAIGIYGVLASLVAQRTREIGIRIALGADRTGVMALIMRQGAVLTGIGITLGLTGAFATTRYLQGMLYGLTPLDVPTLSSVGLGFALVALLASWVPARRATRVNPLTALRSE
jgi:predicted permease